MQSVQRALELIEALQQAETGQIGDLARLHGVHRSTTLRLLRTLEQFGYVSRGRGRGEFRLGLRLYTLGMAASQQNELLQAARPVMRDLAASTNETIDLTLVDQSDMVLLESIASRPFARVGIHVGGRVAAPGTTAGKLALARRSRLELEHLLRNSGLPRVGPKSITDLERYLAELEHVRSRGYAVNDEETDAGVRFVGVPIGVPAHYGQPALVLGAPRYRLSAEAYPRIAAMLGAAAQDIAASVA